MGEEKENNSSLGSYFICVLYANHVGINTVDPKMKDLVAKLFFVIKLYQHYVDQKSQFRWLLKQDILSELYFYFFLSSDYL